MSKSSSNDLKRLANNFISLFVIQGGNYIIPLITLPFLVRVLGVSNYGQVSYAYNYSMYFVILTAFGFNLYAPKKIAENVTNRDEVQGIFSNILSAKIILFLFSFPVFILLIFLIPSLNEIKLVAYFSMIFVLAQVLTPHWLYQGLENMKVITYASLSAKALYAIGLFVFINDQDDYVLVPLINGITHLFIAIYTLRYTYKKFGIQYSRPNLASIHFYLKESFDFFLSRVSVSFYTISNTFILGTFGTMEITGIYAVSEKLFQAMQGVYHPLVSALYPYISRIKEINIYKKIFLLSNLLNIALVTIIYFMAPIIIKILFGADVKESISVFQGLSLVGIVILPSILLGYPLLGAMGYTKFVNLSVIYSSFIHLIALTIILLLDKLTLTNIVLSVFVTETIVFFIRGYGSLKYRLWTK